MNILGEKERGERERRGAGLAVLLLLSFFSNGVSFSSEEVGRGAGRYCTVPYCIFVLYSLICHYTFTWMSSSGLFSVSIARPRKPFSGPCAARCCLEGTKEGLGWRESCLLHVFVWAFSLTLSSDGFVSAMFFRPVRHRFLLHRGVVFRVEYLLGEGIMMSNDSRCHFSTMDQRKASGAVRHTRHCVVLLTLS